jgi:ankyrin repeat protein
MLAAGRGHASIVSMLLMEGAKLETVDTDGCTPLMLAIKHGYTSNVCSLLAAGVGFEATME